MWTAIGCFVIIIMIILIATFPPTPNTLEADGQAGFWAGLLHGMFAPITWLISLFTSSIDFYQVHNNGGWYNFGFVLGAGILFGSSKSK